ncbi:signal peptidase I [Haloarcula salina]|uniref:signal peptidase I n=1 Tax=Haloarcula salina TaxID=1429914 RepID=UPI003C70554F
MLVVSFESRLFEATLFLIMVSGIILVSGQLLGQPVLLGFVTSGSMEPTLDEGDGFVAIPTAITDAPETGDVIVFRAEEIQGGGLTTHRIVEETDRGYITKGDANPFTDQDGGEPPVKDEQIVAVAWQPGGEVLAIPGVGAVVTGTQRVLRTVQGTLASALGTRSLLGVHGLGYLLFALSVLFYAVDAWRDSGRERTSRDYTRQSGTSARLLVAAFTIILVLGATAAMVVPAGPTEFGIVSAESDSPGQRVIEQGTTESTTYPVGNGGLLPVVVFLDPGDENVDVQPRELRVGPRSVENATLALSAPPETGYYRYYVTQHRYLALLPQEHIRGLYQLHPWAPIVVIDAMVGVPFYLVGVSLVGRGRVRDRSRNGGPSLLARFR